MRKIVMVVKIGYEDECEQDKHWRHRQIHRQSEDQDYLELLEEGFDAAEDAVNNLGGSE